MVGGDGGAGQASITYYLCLPYATIPSRGFSWATYLAQSVTSSKLKQSMAPLDSKPLTDRSANKLLSLKANHISHFCYIDNLGMLGVSGCNVQSAMGRCIKNFGGSNLVLHEVDVQASGGKAVGMILDTEKMQTRNTWERHSLIQAAITDVLNQRIVDGCVIKQGSERTSFTKYHKP